MAKLNIHINTHDAGGLAVWLTHLSVVERCLAWSEMGSCVESDMSFSVLVLACHTQTEQHTHRQTHTHTRTLSLIFHFAAPTTPMWGKKSAAATDLSFQPFTKERPLSVPGPRVL